MMRGRLVSATIIGVHAVAGLMLENQPDNMQVCQFNKLDSIAAALKND